MVIATSAIVFAAAAAVGVVFACARPADARFMHRCSGKYHAAAKAGCGANAAKARAPLPRGITLGIGDVVSVTIFEPPGGLFVPSDAGARPGNFVTLPNQMVDSNGNITVPYAGTIPAAGRTPSEVQQAIKEALRVCPKTSGGITKFSEHEAD
jgi:protein involved in polysaccharide export with SLBB domain